MHPLDLVKVRFQLAETPRLQSSPSFSTSPTATTPGVAGSSFTSKRPGFGTAVYGALADAVKTDGWKGLYRGLVPNLVGGAGSWGLYFLLLVLPQVAGVGTTPYDI
jgi:solute carrier family 25 folate transporter 32